VLPLRITLAFKGSGLSTIILHSFDLVQKIKLFKLEIESDTENVRILEKFLREKTLNAHQIIFRVYDIESLKLLSQLKIIGDIEFELPYYFTETDLKAFFSMFKTYKPQSLSFFINKSNINFIEQVFELSKEIGIKKIVIPNPDLINHIDFVKKNYLTIHDLKNLDIIKRYKSFFEINVHDYFIAKSLELEDAKLFKGCQAGKFLCYILNGIVYPCKTVPIKCGTILEEPFEDIWKKVRINIENFYKGSMCIDCEGAKICYYGCPGNVYFLNNGIKDPLCEVENGHLP